MSGDAEKKPAEAPERHFFADELRALMGALQHLYFSVSSQLLHRRLQPPNPSSMAGDSADISASLAAHLDQTAQNSSATANTGGAAPAPSAESTGAGAGIRRRSATERSGLGIFGDLSKHFRQGRARVDVSPHMSEKMRANTMDHISKALRLARQGNAQGAKVHADLAEHAMKAASQYMPEEQYRVFKQEVENRLKSIVG